MPAAKKNPDHGYTTSHGSKIVTLGRDRRDLMKDALKKRGEKATADISKAKKP